MRKSSNTSKNSPTIKASPVDSSISERKTRSRKRRNHGDEFIVNFESKKTDLNKSDDVKASSSKRRLDSFKNTNSSFITSTPVSKPKRRKPDTSPLSVCSKVSKDDFVKPDAEKTSEFLLDTSLLNSQQDSFENSIDNVSTPSALLQKSSQKKTDISSKDLLTKSKKCKNATRGRSAKKNQKSDSSSILQNSESECEKSNSNILKKNLNSVLDNGDFENDISDKVKTFDNTETFSISNLSSCESNTTSEKQTVNSEGKRKQGKPTRSRQSKARSKSVVKDEPNDSVDIPQQNNTSTQERRKRSRHQQSNTKDVAKDESNDLNQTIDSNDLSTQNKSIQEGLPKLKDNNEMAHNSNQSLEPNSLSTIKRGRPSRSRANNKTQNITSDSIEERVEENEPSDDDDLQVSVIQGIIKPKRGRPLKSSKVNLKKQKRSSDVVGVKSSSSIACLLCNVEMTSLAILKRHMMTDHSLVWHPDQPTGVDLPNEIIKRLGHISCQKCAAQRRLDMEGPRQFKFQQYYKHHLIWCGRENETAICDVCNKTVKCMWMDQHLGDHRRKEKQAEEMRRKEQEEGIKKEARVKEEEEVAQEGDVQLKSKRKAAKSAVKLISGLCSGDQNGDADSHSDNDFSDADGDSGDDDEDEDDGEIDEISRKENKEINCTYNYRDHSSMSSIEKAYCKILLPMVRMSHEKRLTLLHGVDKPTEVKKVLFPELLPNENNWLALSQSECLQYRPQQIRSEKFVVTTDSDSCPAENVLEWGQSKVINGKAYCYAGGPIWSLEWCPMPESARGSDQALALSADLSYAPCPDIKTLHTGPGLVQIWSFGKLNNEDCISEAVLKYCVAHDEGYVVSMSWAPSGSFDMTDAPPGCLKRLGLLAVGCSSSVVLVYSLPQPDALKSSNPGPIYKSNPSLLLTPNSKKCCGPCLCVAWQQSGESRHIIAGYSSGSILLWDILTESPLLCVDQTTLRPMQCFKSSRSAVLSCSWNPRRSTAFVATAYDGGVSQFDMTSPELPVSSTSSSLNLYHSTCWAGPLVNGYFLASENLKGIDTSPVNFFGITRNAMKNNFSDFVMQSHSSCVWDVNYCPYYEVLVSCDSMGNVKASLPPMIKVITQALKGLASWHKDNNVARDVYRLNVGATSEQAIGSTESCGEKSQPQEKACDVAESAEQLTVGDKETPKTGLVQASRSLHEGGAVVGVDKSLGTSPESRPKLNHEAAGGDTLYFHDGSLDKPKVKLKSSPETQDSTLFLTNNLSSVHRVRLNPNPASCLWLASGGQAGLLRLDDLSPLAIPQKSSVKAFYDLRYHDKS